MADLTPTAGQDLATYTIRPARLRRFTMKELADLREAMVLASDVLSGQTSQPRYIQPGTCLYNAPGDVLDTLIGMTLAIADRVESEAASRRKGLSTEDAETRAWLLIKARAERGDGLGEVRELATSGEAA